MNLPFFKKKSAGTAPTREYFFALEISPSSVKSAIWAVLNDKTHVLAVGSSANWDGESENSLLTATDQTLSDAATRFDPNGAVSPEKVILGLPPDWLSGEKIQPGRIKLLHTVTQKLSLQAVGFVITPDAVVRFLQHTEGVSPNVILVGFWPREISVTLVRLGRIDSTQVVRRSPQIVADVVEGLSRFSHVDMFPSRILLYDSGLDLEDQKQQLLAHPWQAPQTHLSFLHFPKIEALPGDFTIRAIATAGGTEVARSIGLIPDSVSSEPEDHPPAPVPSATAQELGFLPDTDPLPAPSPAAPPTPEPAAEYIPFPHSPPRPSLPKISFPRLHFSLIFLPLILIALLCGAFAALWYLPRAVVTLTVVPKNLATQFDLTVGTAAVAVDPANRVIPGTVQSVTASADKSAPTTGTKLVGDPATGSVTVINGTGAPHTFTAGTSITSPSGLAFTFDSDVQVASASGTADPNSYQPGKATVNVTASQIGSDSNLSAGTQFRIGTYSTLDFVAKNDVALAGGTSSQVKVVSKDDVAALRTALTPSLQSNARTQLASQIPAADELIPDTVTLQSASEDLDHQIGDQADTVTLRLTEKAQGLTFAKADLAGIIHNQTQSQISADYVIAGDLQHSLAVKKIASNSTTLAVQVSGTLIPRIAQNDVLSHLVGQSPAQAVSYLDSLPGVTHSAITFTPQLPGFLQFFLPHQSSRISLNLQSAK